MTTQTVNLPNTEKNTPLWLICCAILLPTSFAMLATSETNVAIPHIAGFFGATLDEANWVITSYMIANAILIPLTAWFENKLGRVNFLKIFIGLFTIGSLICAFSHSLNIMIVGRLVQGVGGGPLMPMSQAILISSFPFEKRGKAMALFALAVMVSSIMGPTVGGYIVDNSSWQWIYLMNIPVGIVSILLVQLFIPENPHKSKPRKMDTVGVLLLIMWLMPMQIVLDKGQQFDWFGTPWIAWLAGISLFSFIFFIVWELECKNAIVNIRVFKDRNFAVGTLLGAAVNMLIYITIVLLPKYLQGVMKYTAFLSGLSLAPRVISCLVMLCFIDKLVQKVDNRLLIGVGFGLLAISTFWYTNLNLSVSFAYIVIPNVILGAGVILTFIPISALVLGTLPKSELSNGAGLHSLAKCIATVFSVSVSNTLVARLSQAHQYHLVGNLSNCNLIFRRHMEATTHKFMHFYPHLFAQHKAGFVYYKQLIVQSNIFAYTDVFKIFTLIAILLIPLGFMLQVDLDERHRIKERMKRRAYFRKFRMQLKELSSKLRHESIV